MKRPLRRILSVENLFKKGVPKTFHHITIDDFLDYGLPELIQVKGFIKDYLAHIDERFRSNSGIFFYGNNGVGKSMLASLIVKEAYIHRYTSKRITFVDYQNCYTRVWDAGNLEERDYLEAQFYNECKAVEFLVLEEVGKELETKLAPTVLEDCLRYREEKGLVTIICTNLTPAEISDRYNQSIRSLIGGHMTPIKIVGQDHRRSKK